MTLHIASEGEWVSVSGGNIEWAKLHSSVKSMNQWFIGDENITRTPAIITSGVEQFNATYQNCVNLEYAEFDVTGVSITGNSPYLTMFNNCPKLKTIVVHGAYGRIFEHLFAHPANKGSYPSLTTLEMDMKNAKPDGANSQTVDFSDLELANLESIKLYDLGDSFSTSHSFVLDVSGLPNFTSQSTNELVASLSPTSISNPSKIRIRNNQQGSFPPSGWNYEVV